MNEEEKILKVKMFGGLSLNYQGKEIDLKSAGSGRMMQILIIVLFESREGIRRDLLMDRLYGSDSCSDPGNNMRVSFHRLKRALTDAGIPGEKCIQSKKKVYSWNTDLIKLDLDVWRFEEAIKKARETDDRAEEIMYLKEACTLYKGDLLPQASSENWVMVEAVQYQKMYFDALRRLCIYWNKNRMYEEMLSYCTAASKLYPYEEWQIHRIDCLIHLGRNEEAMAVYQETVEFFFEELGVEPSEELMKRFHSMSGQIHYSIKAMDEIKAVLKEKGRAPGAYYCSYPSFVDTYRYVVRTVERGGQSVYLMLCSITDQEGNMTRSSDKTEDELRTAIQESLRRGDIFTKFSPNQFLIMMSGIKQEDCSLVSARIDVRFNKLHWGRDKKINYYLSTILDDDEYDDERTITFRSSKNLWGNI